MKKHLIIGGAAAAAALAIPAVAQAHNVAVTCQNGQIVAQGSAFPVSPAVTSVQLTVDGVPGPLTQVAPIPGPNPRYVFPEPLYGAHTLVVQFVNGGPWTSPATPVVCGDAPPAPGPTPVQPVPGPFPVQPTPAPPPVQPTPRKKKAPTTCANLPKSAGKKWRDKFCGKPPRKMKVCVDKRRVAVGRRVNGRIVWRCVLVTPPPRDSVPVTGEKR